MPSFKSAAAAATALFTVCAQAQAVYNIDPSTVTPATRSQWCQSQVTACPLLCLQLPGESSTTESNECDAATLIYSCVCGNGASPNASEYSQTIPFFECQEFGNQCVAACNGDTTCQFNCRSQHPCGAQSPIRVNTTTSSSMPATTTLPAGASSGTNGVVYTGLGGSGAAPTSGSSSNTNKSGAQTALDLGRSYGLAIVFSGIFAGFALIM